MTTVADEFLTAIWGQLRGRLFQNLGELRMIRPPVALGDPRAFSMFYESATDAGLASELYSQMNWDVYFGVLPRVRKGGKAEDTMHMSSVLWADFDAKNGRTMAEARREIATILPPQIVVDSGHGYHCYWLLDGLYPFSDAQTVMIGIEREHGADHCSDAPRILRVPGTRNFKQDPSLPVRVVKFDTLAARYPLDAFHEYTVPASTSFAYGSPVEIDFKTSRWTPSTPDAPKFPEGTRNNNLTRLAGIMLDKGMSPEDLTVALSWENEHRCDPPLMAHEVQAIARSVERYRP